MGNPYDNQQGWPGDHAAVLHLLDTITTGEARAIMQAVPKYIYLIGSLRNPNVPDVAHDLRGAGFSVFDDWYAAGATADDDWMDYEKDRGRTYLEALDGVAARHAFELDQRHLELADVGVLVLPAGKSGHLELGWVARLKPTFVLLENGDEPSRWDLMYKLCTGVCPTVEDLIGKLKLL